MLLNLEYPILSLNSELLLAVMVVHGSFLHKPQKFCFLHTHNCHLTFPPNNQADKKRADPVYYRQK